MLIISLIPTRTANWFAALVAAERRPFALLLFLGRAEGLVGAAVAHPAIAAGVPQQVHTLLRAALRHHAATALVVKHGLL